MKLHTFAISFSCLIISPWDLHDPEYSPPSWYQFWNSNWVGLKYHSKALRRSSSFLLVLTWFHGQVLLHFIRLGTKPVKYASNFVNVTTLHITWFLNSLNVSCNFNDSQLKLGLLTGMDGGAGSLILVDCVVFYPK